MSNQNNNRREFLTNSAAAAGVAVAAANLASVANVHAGNNNDEIRVGLVGCGGRGSGAAEQCVNGGENVKLVAMGDAFQDRLNGALNRFQRSRRMQGKVDVPRERQFVGLDAYQNVIRNCDLVILATPPGFRPIHIAAAIAAGKHLFTEKPVAVDGPGIRSVLASYAEANRRNLKVVAGTQRRYQTGYLQSMQRIHDGAIGDITSARCYWNQGRLWNRARTPQMTDVEWHIRNWLYFTWLSGDHICEQHIHNLDVVNWATRSHPAKAVGLGGRQVRTAEEFGHIFDHHAVDFEYANGARVLSMCRQIQGCANNVSEEVTGTRGRWNSPGPITRNYQITGPNEWTFNRRNDNRPYDQEHVELINAIRNDTRLNALQDVAHSTLTAIMGRMATYTGQQVTWEQALNSQESLMPEGLTFDMRLPVPPVPMPGQTELR